MDAGRQVMEQVKKAWVCQTARGAMHDMLVTCSWISWHWRSSSFAHMISYDILQFWVNALTSLQPTSYTEGTWLQGNRWDEPRAAQPGFGDCDRTVQCDEEESEADSCDVPDFKYLQVSSNIFKWLKKCKAVHQQKGSDVGWNGAETRTEQELWSPQILLLLLFEIMSYCCWI